MTRNSDKFISILSIVTILMALLILGWVILTLYKFYAIYTKPAQGISTETFIDSTGLKEVKLILEQRK